MVARSAAQLAATGTAWGVAGIGASSSGQRASGGGSGIGASGGGGGGGGTTTVFETTAPDTGVTDGLRRDITLLQNALEDTQERLAYLTSRLNTIDADTTALLAALDALTLRVVELETHRWEPLVGGEPASPDLIYSDGNLIWDWRETEG